MVPESLRARNLAILLPAVWTPLAVLLLAATPHRLSALERSPVALLVTTPRGQSTTITRSEIIRAVTGQLRSKTDLEPSLIDDQRLTECEARIACLLRGGIDSPLLLEVVVSSGAPQDRISVSLLDLERARAFLHLPPLEAEGAIAERAIIAGPVRAPVQNVEDFFAELFDETLATPLRRRGHWKRFGTLVLDAPPGLELVVDGRRIGETLGRSEIEVETGTRTVVLSDGATERWRRDISIVDRVTVQATLPTRSLVPAVRTGLLWTGVGLAAAGLAITAYGGTQHRAGVASACFECPERSGFARFGYDASKTERMDFDVNPSGLAIIPFGLSLFSAGAVFSLGTLLFGEEEDLPWIQAVTGILLGAATYGIMVAAEG